MSDGLAGYASVNVFNYTSPELAPGLKLWVELAGADTAALEVSSDPEIGATYAAGPLNAYIGYVNATSAWDLRVNYDFGVAKVGVRTTDSDRTGGARQELAITAPVGPVTVGYHLAQNDLNKATGYSVVYPLSKRTSINYSYVKGVQKSGSAGFDGNNYRLQLRTTF
jgi:hypothetical protein